MFGVLCLVVAAINVEPLFDAMSEGRIGDADKPPQGVQVSDEETR